MKEWFKARNIWGTIIEALTDEQVGRLMRAVWAYTANGETVTLGGMEQGFRRGGARISDVQLCFWQDEAFSREPGEGGRREAPTYRNDWSRFVVPDAIR